MARELPDTIPIFLMTTPHNPPHSPQPARFAPLPFPPAGVNPDGPPSWIQSWPQNWIERGNLWHQAGDQIQAATCYQQAVELDPTAAQAWFNLGVARSLTGELDLALAAYQQAIATRPR